MKKIANVVLMSAVLAVWACGGKTFGNEDGDGGGGDDGGANDGGSGGDGGACAPLPGCSSATSCPSSDGCNECTCFNGEWACGDLGCVVDASTTCPASPPDVGSFCEGEGVVCTFGTQCGPEFTCRNNAWGMTIRTCPPPVCPPSPPSGDCSGQIGLTCSWGSGCNEEMCQCMSNGNQAVWECSGTACVDAGHTGD
jgi:hypothetical protein